MGVLSRKKHQNVTFRGSGVNILSVRAYNAAFGGGRPMTNLAIARKLRTHAHELERKKENLYRVRAFRRAAEAVLRLDEPVAEIVARGGPSALAAVPGIGPSLATTILGYATFGVWVTRTQPVVKN